MPDIGLRDWKKFDQAIQEGYDTARACIEKNGVPLTHVWSDGPRMPFQAHRFCCSLSSSHVSGCAVRASAQSAESVVPQLC